MNKPVHRNPNPDLIALIWGLDKGSPARHVALLLTLLARLFKVAASFTHPHTPHPLGCLGLARAKPSSVAYGWPEESPHIHNLRTRAPSSSAAPWVTESVGLKVKVLGGYWVLGTGCSGVQHSRFINCCAYAHTHGGGPFYTLPAPCGVAPP